MTIAIAVAVGCFAMGTLFVFYPIPTLFATVVLLVCWYDNRPKKKKRKHR